MLILFFILVVGSGRICAQTPSVNSSQNITDNVENNFGNIRTSVSKNPINENLLQAENAMIYYRRWLVPRDRIWDWPLKDGPYVSLKRERFEQWVDLMKRSGEKRQTKQNKCLTRIFLHAKLEGRQLVDGKGFFILPDRFSDVDGQALPETKRKNMIKNRSVFFPLEPWNLHVAAATWEGGSPASIVRNSNEETSLIITSEMPDPETNRQVHFIWSLRGRSDSQGRMQFDFDLPESMSFEIQLDLPSYIIPSIPVGIIEKSIDNVHKVESNKDSRTNEAGNEKETSVFSRWKLMLRHHTKATVTLSIDERYAVAQQKTGYRNHVYYSISQQGLDVTSRIHFGKDDSTLNEFYLDIEDPLRLLEITNGDQTIPWTAFRSDLDRTRIQVNINGIGKSENREITIKAIGPTLENRNWTLPRLEVVSPNVFWNETRYGVIVQKPLLVRNIQCRNATQVPPLTTAEQSDREVFAYRLFEPTALVMLNLEFEKTKLTQNSFTQIQWSGNEIKSETLVDCSVFDGETFFLNIPISEHWTINTIKATTDDIISSWDIIEGHSLQAEENISSRHLVIQFQKPYRPKDGPLRFHIQGRFLSSPPRQFKLKNLSPFQFSNSDETHLIAISLEPPFHLRGKATSSESQDKLLRNLDRFQGVQPQGSLFILDAKNLEKLFAIEQLNPIYSCTVKGVVQVQKNELALNYQFSCIPADSSVDRVYIYFSSIDSLTTLKHWQWSINGDTSQLTAKRLEPSEWSKLFPQHARRSTDDNWPGECWELRLDNARSMPFEIRAALPISLGEVFQIPLATLPLASSQKGEIYIEASRLPDYQIVNSRLQSIPIALPNWYRYQNVRAAFRYDPVEEFRQLNPSPLLFKRVASGDIPPSAWAWMLRLDTQYENEGTVMNNAVFLLENRGKGSLRITLPNGIYTANVHAVWLDDKRITWHPDFEKKSSDNEAATKKKSTSTSPNVVVVALPEGRRFVSVSIEYSYQDKKLTLHRHLTPRYPKADVPVLTGSWTSWLPPDFDVSTRFRKKSFGMGNTKSLSRAVDYYLSSKYFNMFSLNSWRHLLYGKQYEEEAVEASRIFLNWISIIFNESVDKSAFSSYRNWSRPDTFISPTTTAFLHEDSRSSDRNWSDLLQTYSLLNEMMVADEKFEKNRSVRKSKLQKEGEHSAGSVIMIDRQAFNYYGITPTSPLTLYDNLQTRKYPAEILEQNGLVLLISPRLNEQGEQEYVFYITSFLMSAIQHQFDSQPIGNGIRFVSDERSLYPNGDDSQDGDWTTDIGTPQWISAEEWIREESPIMFPWTISSQVSRLASVTPDWIAYEIPKTNDSSLYIVHRNTFRAYHFLAFLAALLLTWKRPFSSPIILIPLIILFEIWARWTVPCYLGIPSGAFFGVVCSLCFELVRARTKIMSESFFRLRNSKIIPPILMRDDSDESVEVRIPDDLMGRERSLTGAGSEKPKTPEPSIKTEVFFSQFSNPTAPNEQETENPAKKPEDEDDSKPDSSSSDRGITLGLWFFVIVLLLLGLATSPAVFSSEMSETTKTIQENRKTSGKLVSSGEVGQNLLFDRSLRNKQERDNDSDRQGGSIPITPPRREPYRVFYPTDETQKIADDFVWLPEPFFRWLSRHVQSISPKTKQLWSIEKAEYEATLSSSLSQNLAISEFKVVFHIILEESNTMITMPALPIVPDTATWDALPIQPIWQIREKQSDVLNEPEENRLMVFNLENEKKGRHRLELTLDPKIMKSDDLRRISFEIPKVPDSVLKLNLPIDAPTIHISDSLGAVLPNSIESPTLKAEIGPSEKLAFHWIDQQSRNDNATVSVETMLRIRTRPLQLRAKFRFRIEGGKIRHVNIQTDPRWQLSGQFHCEEQPIERTETYYNSGVNDVIPPLQNEVTRLIFKSPTSGILTIQASFMLRDFSGIGNIRMPQIRSLQAETLRSLLAVYGDPVLDLGFPEDGLGTGFETLWHSELSSDSRPVASRPQNPPSENSTVGPTPDTDGLPLAVYDLTKTTSSWILSIRAKEEFPELSLKQSCYLDDSESSIVSEAVFSSQRDVFQIPFTVDDSLRIDSVEIFDSEDNSVGCRWSDSQYHDTSQNERKLIIFLKRPLSGTFKATVFGHFDCSESDEKQIGNSERQVPLLTFHHAKLMSHDLEIYRSSSVLTEVNLDMSFWSQSESVSVAPQSFHQPIKSGSWKERLEILSERQDKSSDKRKLKTSIPSFRISPNRPIIHGEVVTSLSRSPSGNTWELSFDIIWTIDRGELRSLRFQWDERCGSVLSVHPPIPMTLEQKNGRTQLLLSPSTPFTGKQHFRIRALLNPVGNTISIPTIEPILENIDSFRNNIYIVLPRDFAGIAIPWNLSNLAPVDAEIVEHLKEQTGKKFKEDHYAFFSNPSVLSTSFMNPSPLSFGSISLSGAEFPVKESISTSEPLFYQATSSDFTASIVHRNEKPIATLFDINYCIRNNGNLFGMMTIDLKSQGHDSCILTMPPNFELIQLISAGISSSGSRLMDRRWKIELSSSDYPQRISVVFRGSIEFLNGKNKTERNESPHFSLQKLMEGRWTTSIPLPMLENVDIKETLWTLSFESAGSGKLPLLSISSIREETVVPDDPILPLKKRDITEFLGNCLPVVGLEASETLIKLDLVRLNNLLISLDSLSKPIPATKFDEVVRWESQWSKEWNGLLKMIDYQQLAHPQAIYASDHQVLLDSIEKQKQSASGQSIGLFLDSMKPTEMSLRALLVRKESLIGKMGLPPLNNQLTDRSRQLSTTFLVHYRSRINECSSHLFGATEGNMKELRIESIPVTANWAESLMKFSILWILAPIALVLLFRKLQFPDIVVQFPHFWGAIVGLLLWSLFPVGLLGASVLILVLFSLWYSPWPRRELISEKNELT